MSGVKQGVFQCPFEPGWKIVPVGREAVPGEIQEIHEMLTACLGAMNAGIAPAAIGKLIEKECGLLAACKAAVRHWEVYNMSGHAMVPSWYPLCRAAIAKTTK